MRFKVDTLFGTSFKYVFTTLVIGVLTCQNALARDCSDLDGEWQFVSTGSLSGQGRIVFVEQSKGSYRVRLDLSPSKSDVRISEGVASCTGDKFIVEIGGFPGQFSNLRLVGGTIVGLLETKPLEHVFGSWEMTAVDIETFNEVQVLGFARLTKIGHQGE